MSDADHGVPFDINGLGRMFRVAFPTGSDDAWLAFDRNADGTINNGSELFGNTTLLESGRPAQDGFVALAEFDSNKDGLVSEADVLFSGLILWTDLNRNGQSEPDELLRLMESPVMGTGNEGAVFLKSG